MVRDSSRYWRVGKLSYFTKIFQNFYPAENPWVFCDAKSFRAAYSCDHLWNVGRETLRSRAASHSEMSPVSHWARMFS